MEFLDLRQLAVVVLPQDELIVAETVRRHELLEVAVETPLDSAHLGPSVHGL